MVPSRGRRTAIRWALPILLALAIVPAVSLTLGPALSAQRLTGPIPPAVSPRATLEHREPDTIHVPAPDPTIPAVSSILRQPRIPGGPSATPTMRIALKTRLDQIREKYAMPGISVTVIFPDGTMWTGVSGMADVAGKVPVTHDTAFALASVTKTFTAALILQMVEDGEVELDASVAKYLPGLRVDPKVTIRQLLDHTSGLRDYFFHPAIDRILVDHPDRIWTEAESFKYVGKPYFKPGRGWRYSNTNYLVLGMVAERVAGASLADLYRERFFDPLGLDGAYYQPTETARGPVAHGYRFKTSAKDARPIDLTAEGPVVPFASVVTAARGAGALAATSSDVARWARALYAGGVLESSTVQEMLDDVSQTERYRPTVPYGLGVQLTEIGGEPALGHSGRLLGFRSAARFMPESGMTIAVLTNQSRTDPGIVVRALLKISLQPSRECDCPGRR
jgi:D-alanyl-D-alanine carboxypeptidase